MNVVAEILEKSQGVFHTRMFSQSTFRNVFSGLNAIIFSILVIATLLLGGMALESLRVEQSADAGADHIQAMLGTIRELDAALSNGDREQVAYLLTTRGDFLDAYKSALKVALDQPQALETLRLSPAEEDGRLKPGKPATKAPTRSPSHA